MLKYFLQKLTTDQLKTFMYKRLPIYILALFIFLLFGVKGLVITFFLVVFFVLGWTLNKIYSIVSDYRLAQKINRIHYTTIEFEALKRQNKALYEAVKAYQDGAVGRGGSAVVRPPTAPTKPRIDQQQIQEMILQYESGVERD